MFLTQLRHELLKLFARKRTYIGFGAFVVVQITILLLLQMPKARRAFRHLLEKHSLAAQMFAAVEPRSAPRGCCSRLARWSTPS